jgi:hypothetical protein
VRTFIGFALYASFLLFVLVFIIANVWDLMCFADGLWATIDPRCARL